MAMLTVIADTETRLRALGIAPGIRVALHMPNSAAMAVTVVVFRTTSPRHFAFQMR